MHFFLRRVHGFVYPFWTTQWQRAALLQSAAVALHTVPALCVELTLMTSKLQEPSCQPDLPEGSGLVWLRLSQRGPVWSGWQLVFCKLVFIAIGMVVAERPV